MPVVKLRIDISGTTGNQAWSRIKPYPEAQSAFFGPEYGRGGPCGHAPDAPHTKGEWYGAEVLVPTPLLAQYAVSHYLEQERVLDADVEG
jgi:hypothetical protein